MDEPVKLGFGESQMCVLFFLLDAMTRTMRVVADVAIATIDHSDIRGSEPHAHDPSGATVRLGTRIEAHRLTA
jgi:hypothetical protein